MRGPHRAGSRRLRGRRGEAVGLSNNTSRYPFLNRIIINFRHLRYLNGIVLTRRGLRCFGAGRNTERFLMSPRGPFPIPMCPRPVAGRQDLCLRAAHRHLKPPAAQRERAQSHLPAQLQRARCSLPRSRQIRHENQTTRQLGHSPEGDGVGPGSTTPHDQGVGAGRSHWRGHPIAPYSLSSSTSPSCDD